MTACGCIHVDDSIDDPEFFTTSHSTARKKHRCGECGRDIETGENYESVTGCWDGNINRHKTCADCLSVRNEFFCYGYIFGELWDRVGEHVRELRGEIASECILRLTPSARETMFDLIEEAWELPEPKPWFPIQSTTQTKGPTP
jgi:hypothetical protein